MNKLQTILKRMAEELPAITLTIIKVEGLNFIKKNFREQGFNDGGLAKWAPRKTTNQQGRDLTRYRTNRSGRAGGLTGFGQRDQGRAILVGHATGGDKLKNSFSATVQGNTVVFRSYKPYAEAHNEGTKTLPQRQFIGKSADLDKQIKDKLEAKFKQLLK